MNSGLTFANAILYQGQKPLDCRLQFDTIAEMVAYPDYSLYEGIESYNKEDGNYYNWKSTNDVDAIYGKWRVRAKATNTTLIVDALPTETAKETYYLVKTIVKEDFYDINNGSTKYYVKKDEFTVGKAGDSIDVYTYDSTKEVESQMTKSVTGTIKNTTTITISSTDYTKGTETKNIQTTHYFKEYYSDTNKVTEFIANLTSDMMSKAEIIKLIKGTEYQADHIEKLKTENPGVTFDNTYSNVFINGEVTHHLDVKINLNDMEIRSRKKLLLKLPAGTFSGRKILDMYYIPSLNVKCEENRHIYFDKKPSNTIYDEWSNEIGYGSTYIYTTKATYTEGSTYEAFSYNTTTGTLTSLGNATFKKVQGHDVMSISSVDYFKTTFEHEYYYRGMSTGYRYIVNNITIDASGYATQKVNNVTGDPMFDNNTPICNTEEVELTNTTTEYTINFLKIPHARKNTKIVYDVTECAYAHGTSGTIPSEGYYHDETNDKWYDCGVEKTVTVVTTKPEGSESTLKKLYLLGTKLYVGTMTVTNIWDTQQDNIKLDGDYIYYRKLRNSGINVDDNSYFGSYYVNESARSTQISVGGIGGFEGTYGFTKQVNKQNMTSVKVWLEDDGCIYCNGDTTIGGWLILSGEVK